MKKAKAKKSKSKKKSKKKTSEFRVRSYGNLQAEAPGTTTKLRNVFLQAVREQLPKKHLTVMDETEQTLQAMTDMAIRILSAQVDAEFERRFVGIEHK
jgi:hypothetical protein